jgi:hypothetical protein
MLSKWLAFPPVFYPNLKKYWFYSKSIVIIFYHCVEKRSTNDWRFHSLFTEIWKNIDFIQKVLWLFFMIVLKNALQVTGVSTHFLLKSEKNMQFLSFFSFALVCSLF